MTITRSEDYAWLHSGHLTVEFIAFLFYPLEIMPTSRGMVKMC